MGLTFLNGIFALAFAAVALPILIHLLFRRRTRREPYPSIEFLEQITERQRRRIRLRHWLLLALRVLVIALLAMAMMRPALPGSGGGGSGSTTGIVVLDNSFSMQATTEAGSLVETAGRRVRELGRLFGEGDRLQLVFPTTPPTAAFDGPVQDFGRIESAIRAAPVLYMPAAQRLAFEEALRLAQEAASLNREVYIISDFQEADWADAASFARIPEGVRVYLVPVVVSGLPNVAIANASIVKASVRSGGAGAVRVTLANFSDGELAAYPVRVFADDGVLAEGTLAVPREEYATLDLPLARPLSPEETIQVRIPEDVLSADDVAWLASGERQAIRVLIVHGGSPDDVAEEPYLRLALDPPGQAGERVFTVQEVALQDFPVRAELDYDAFVLNNVGRLSDGAIARLRLAHRDGAGIVFILGDRVDLAYANGHILPEFIDVTLEEPVSADGGFFALNPQVTGHPVFEGFKVGAGDPLTAARFLTVVRARVGASARLLATFGSLPALVEGDRVLLFTSSVDLRWGSFPTGGSFLPFIHQAVLTVAASVAQARRFEAGEPIAFALPAASVPGEVICLKPDGSTLPVHAAIQAGRVEIRTDPASTPGVYKFLSGRETLRRVAVLLDAGEGRLRYRDPGTLAASLGEAARVLTLEGALAARVLEDRHGREIWRELVLAALLLLVIETAVGRVRIA